jgi:putative acetyltransferase
MSASGGGGPQRKCNNVGMPTMLTIRPEGPSDLDAIFQVNSQAFSRDNEARVVDALRRSPAFIPELSLAARIGERAAQGGPGGIVGHILFTRITIREAGRSHDALALAPLAVLPAHQKQGVGSALMRRGLDDARQLGHRIVIVLGHPDYYPRFGFAPASTFGIRPPFDVRNEAFMALALEEGALGLVRGEVNYPPEFTAV